MLPPSWLTALCAPARPIRPYTCFSSARSKPPARFSAALDPADRARVRSIGRSGRAPPSAWPTRRRAPAGPRPAVRAAVARRGAGRADAVVSAGNTGATVTSAALGLGRWPGVRRPALAAVLPTPAGRLVLLDVGSSVDPDEQTLAMHARLGAAYAPVVHESRNPGSACSPSAPSAARVTGCAAPSPAVLAASTCPPAAGTSVWSRATTSSPAPRADVVVTDGFTGNVLLKGLETAYALAGPPHAATERTAARRHPPRRLRHRRRLPRRGHRSDWPPASRWPPTCTAAPRSKRYAHSSTEPRGDRMSSDESAGRRPFRWRRRSVCRSSPTCCERALTHRSYAYENGGLPTNERLEFLGDSVLGVVITSALFHNHPDLPEGQLAKLRASVVNMHALADVARTASARTAWARTCCSARARRPPAAGTRRASWPTRWRRCSARSTWSTAWTPPAR